MRFWLLEKFCNLFAPKLAGLCVKWHTDNQNVARIIGVGSRMSGLQSEAKRIFEVCVHHGISIEPECLPRSSNEQADYLSRIVDFDDWSVSPHIFRFLDLKCGPHSIDRSADEHNHLLPRFDSRFWNPYCEAMDTFTRSWDFDNNWVCPPPHLVPRTLKHMRSCCAQGTLIPFGALLHFGLYLQRTVLIWLILLKIGWTCPLEDDFLLGSPQLWCFWQR